MNDVQPTGWQARAVRLLASLLTLCGLAWVTDVPRSLGLLFYNEQYLLVVLGLGLAMCFLSAVKQAPSLLGRPWPGAFLALAQGGLAIIALATTLYAARHYEDLLMASAMMRTDTVIVGVLLTTLTVIAVYRVAGVFLAAVVLFFLFQTHIAGSMPAILQGRSVAWERIFAYLSTDSTAILGLPLSISASTVFAFILFGTLIARFGGGDFFTDLAMRSVGRYRGGSAKAAVVGSAFFGSVSGSAVANIVATGVVSIPLMKRAGYRSEQAAAIEAVSSTGGQLLPPIMGAAAFLMAEFLQISYGTVLVHALVPALLYYIAVMFYVDLVAGRDRIAPVDAAERKASGLRRRALVYVTPFVVLLVCMFSFNRTPEESALLAALTLVLLKLLPIAGDDRRPRFSDMGKALAETGLAMMDIVVITAAAGIVIGLINVSGSAFALSVYLLDLGGSSLLILLLVTALVSIVLGMGMPTVGVYVLLATLAAPAIVRLGVEPIAAHLFVLYFGLMSMLSPPVAVASYVAASMAKGSPVRTSFEALRLGWVAFIIPFLFIYSPSLLLVGSPWQVALTVATALPGVWLITASFVGFLMTPLSGLARVLAATAVIGLLLPVALFDGAHWANLAGAVLAIVLVMQQRRAGISPVLPEEHQ
ncbi:TRAP transporter fused permease subunit [Halomonas denitrificans]|uniref:TRAP transporter permease n=1 Tax=Halomonas denitrificans TaxID=370769 RepID=UPI001CD1D6A5|nr:TRAP transporter fused permease subunit [Halomonas denitrificans]MCA0973968.1 TRAP transporter fused permease subunit [Halomonas denitrificans]